MLGHAPVVGIFGGIGGFARDLDDLGGGVGGSFFVRGECGDAGGCRGVGVGGGDRAVDGGSGFSGARDGGDVRVGVSLRDGFGRVGGVVRGVCRGGFGLWGGSVVWRACGAEVAGRFGF